MFTGVGGLFGPRPRPLTMRVRERGRGPSREEGWWGTRGGFGRWVGDPGEGVRGETTEQRRRRARRWQRCGVVAVCGVGGVGAQRWLSTAVSDAAARMASAASTSRRSWRHQALVSARASTASRGRRGAGAAGAVLGGGGARRRAPVRLGRPSRRRGYSSDAEPRHRQDVPTVAARPPITTHARRPRLVPPRVEAVP